MEKDLSSVFSKKPKISPNPHQMAFTRALPMEPEGV
jgi:hypothetical protein